MGGWAEGPSRTDAQRPSADQGSWHTSAGRERRERQPPDLVRALPRQLADELRKDYWRLDGLPTDVWVHRDSDRAPQRPLVFVLDLTTLPAAQSGGRAAGGRPATAANPGAVRSIAHTGPEDAPLPPFAGPPVLFIPGMHRLALTVDAGRGLSVTDLLVLET